MKKICFDLDGTLCSNTWGKYHKAKPFKKAIIKVNELYNLGFYIMIFTARFTGKNNENLGKENLDGYIFTKKQIDSWGIKYHKLILGKPNYDIIIDDKQIGYNQDWIKFDFKEFLS